MGLLSKLVGGTVVEAADGIAGIVDRFVETPDERAALETLRARMAARPHELQAEINKIEAGHRSIFVAGWRPFVGWVCGTALAYNFILRDLLAWVIVNSGSTASIPPDLAVGDLLWLLGGLLGLGGTLRTVEKLKGKAR